MIFVKLSFSPAPSLLILKKELGVPLLQYLVLQKIENYLQESGTIFTYLNTY